MYLPICSNLIPLNEAAQAIGMAETPAPEFDENLSLFCRCKEAMYAVITHCPVPGKRALLPAYTCETVIEPFRQAGWEFAFYPLDLHLRIAPEAFRKLLREFRPNFVVAQVLYGMDLNDDELALLQEAKDAGCFIMEDLTHAFYSRRRPPMIDAYVGSIRKWLPIPDGGFLRSDVLPRLDEGLEVNQKFFEYFRAALHALRLYIDLGDKEAMACFRLLEDAGRDPSITPHRMTDFSKRIMAADDAERSEGQRLENCRYLFENLQNCKSCKPVYQSIDDMTTGPLWFPVYVQDKKRFHAECSKPYRFSAPGLWPVETPDVLVDGNTKFIYNHIVAISCSQNFNVEHMKRIVEGFRAWDLELEMP